MCVNACVWKELRAGEISRVVNNQAPISSSVRVSRLKRKAESTRCRDSRSMSRRSWKVFAQFDYFPPELVSLAGALGCGLEMSIYPRDLYQLARSRRKSRNRSGTLNVHEAGKRTHDVSLTLSDRLWRHGGKPAADANL
jgi:hypothetical protein